MRHLRTVPPAVRRALSALLLALAVAFVAPPAAAGTLQIKDSAQVLGAGEASALRSGAAAYPFDVRVVTTSEHADAASFDRYVGAQVASPNMVVVGVDPAHHRTSVHVGTGTGIAPSEARAIEAAGAAAFRAGAYDRGIAAILDRARASVGTAARGATAAAGEAAPEARRSGASLWFAGFLAIVGVVGVGIAVAAAVARRNAAGGGLAAPGGWQGNGPVPPGGYPPPGYGQGYGPGYGYGPPAGRSGLGTGLMGAGLGGLVGYELGKMAGERGHAHDDAGSHAAAWQGDDAPHGGGYDAGGSTSSWDDDAGSGGSDWGGGDSGGFDGGGFDGGGGGSDW